MFAGVVPTALAASWTPFQPASLNDLSCRVPTSVTKPILIAFGPDGLAPELLQAPNTRTAVAASASVARDTWVRMDPPPNAHRVATRPPRGPVRADRRR